ncbi:MAG: hypothetical protein JKX82_08870 [Oleispira sp.]|nr:hypothetical protein [Oleispira sp.]
MELAIADGFYQSRSLPLSAQQCVNYYPVEVKHSTGEVLRVSLFGTPGLSQLATTGTTTQVNRGAHTLNGIPYFVNGTTLYRLNADLSTDSLGTITGVDRVSMAENGTQLMILSHRITDGAAFGYIYTTGGGLVTISDLDFTASGEPQVVVFTDGYFLLNTDTKKFIVSALNDGTSYNALDFGSAEANTDATVAPFPFKGQVFMFGSESCEVFSNIGGSSFPYQRVNGYILSQGLSAKHSIISTGNTFMWIGAGKDEGPAIWMFNNGDSVKISTEAIDNLLEEEVDLANVFGWSYSRDGAYFVGWTLNGTSIVFDTSSRRWHERKSDIIDGEVITNSRWRVNSIVTAYNKLICFDFIDGRVGELDLDTYSEYDAIIQRVVSTRMFENQGRPFTVPFIELTVESGVGNAESIDPQIRMDRSKDAKTYTDERARSVGKIGKFNQRVVWYRNGRADRFEIFRFKFSEKAKSVIIKCEADIVA